MGVRVSIESLMDHRCTVYRLTETLNELREKVNSYVAAETSQKLALVPPKFSADDEGSGESARGSVEGFMPISSTVQRTDVLDVTSGPEAPLKLLVVNVARPRNHHAEVTLEPFHGSLT